jgi:TonB family protein
LWGLLIVALFFSVQAAGKADPASVFLAKLSKPVYPPIAAVARIAGDVELTIVIRPDGTVESVETASGHQLLKQAALDSVRRSQFECRDCRSSTSYSLTYRFTIAPRDPPKNCDGDAETPPPDPEIDSPRRLVTVYAWTMWTCDPSVTLVRIRSVKCLYLWKCGRREAATAEH